MDEGAFDVIILGTGLTESITATALSKAGFKVAHINEKPYYGANEASLSLDKFIQWGDNISTSTGYSSFSQSGESLPKSRSYSISLSPSVIPSLGPLISSLVASGVSRYGGFRLIERVGMYDSSGVVKSVLGSKEDVFKNKEISLLDKQRLMRFLMYAAGKVEGSKEIQGKEDTPFCDFLRAEFKLNEEMVKAIAYALAYCFAPSDPMLPALQCLNRYLRSAGRYGTSPFLVGHYGSSGEIAQGFCRTAAVCGAVYILGRTITSISHTPTPKDKDGSRSSDEASTSTPSVYTVHLDDFPDPLTCNLLISSASHVPEDLLQDTKHVESPLQSDPTHGEYTIAWCVAIIDQPLSFGSSVSMEPEPTPEAEEEADLNEDEDTPSSQSGAAPPRVENMDTGILVFPPSSLEGGLETGSVTAFIAGEGTMSTPQGKWIIYISAPISCDASSQASPETILTPYLDAALGLSSSSPSTDPTTPVKALFKAFYFEHSRQRSDVAGASRTSTTTTTTPTTRAPTYLIPPPLPPLPLPDAPDAVAVLGEAVFREAVRVLRSANNRLADSGEIREEGDSAREEVEEEPVSFWPPLDSVGGEDEGEDV